MSNPDLMSPFGTGDRYGRDCPPQVRPKHREKLAIVYIRQSSMGQVRENFGSTADQRELAELPRQWGWPDSNIRVIDGDLRESGTSTVHRDGFQELLDFVRQDQVGLLLAREFSRIGRNAVENVQFVETARRAKLLIWSGRMYDMGSDNDAEIFALQLEALLAELENATRVRRFRAARVAKARQGHAVSRPPIGYIKSVHGQWIKDPEPAVQQAISRLFELAPKFGSLGAMVRYLRVNKLDFPRRRRGALTWESPSRVRLHSVLKNPGYTGYYVYGQVRIIPGLDGKPRRIEPRPESDWIKFPGHHDPYVTYEHWKEINATLAARRTSVRPIVGKGDALLQGLLRCGQCRRWLRTQYSARNGQARGASYICRPIDLSGRPLHSISCPARLIDPSVVRAVLAALTPIEIDAALSVIEDAVQEQKRIHRDHARQLQTIADEVAEAETLYRLAARSNRRTTNHFEGKLEEALERQEKLQRELANAMPAPTRTVTLDDAAELRELTANIQQLWNATGNEDRKRLLRAVVTEIVVHTATKEAVELEIVWIGGFRQRLRALRPGGVDQQIAEARKNGKDAAAIVDDLRAADIATRRGTPMKRHTVYGALKRVGLSSTEQRRQVLLLIRQLLVEKRARPEMLKIVQSEAPPALGPWTRQRLNQYVSKLYRGIPGIPPLPTPLPAEQGKQAVIDLIRRRHDEGASWTPIAGELNASGLRPPRASAFTAPQVARLFARWQKQHPQGGPGGMAAT
jgi:DNA invertase Pin-like site-specific DNA recombinase